MIVVVTSATHSNLRSCSIESAVDYAMGRTHAELARMLRRDERTIRDWLSGRAKVPWWVPEIMRLKRVEADLGHRQMFCGAPDKKSDHTPGLVADDGSLERRDPQKKHPRSQT
jgi:hypothetical protein